MNKSRKAQTRFRTDWNTLRLISHKNDDDDQTAAQVLRNRKRRLSHLAAFEKVETKRD